MTQIYPSICFGNCKEVFIGIIILCILLGFIALIQKIKEIRKIKENSKREKEVE
jgi:hypothetical protein